MKILGSGFVKWMAYELNGRATMHALTSDMARRFNEGPMHVYWSSYHQLEEFSRTRYEAAARIFGIELPGKSWVSIKSRVISWLPGFMIPSAILWLRDRTVAYVERLRWLSEIGPAEAGNFYSYMVRQEILQVQLMGFALEEEYSAAKSLVERFIAQESAMRQFQF